MYVYVNFVYDQYIGHAQFQIVTQSYIIIVFHRCNEHRSLHGISRKLRIFYATMLPWYVAQLRKTLYILYLLTYKRFFVHSLTVCS